LIWGTTQSLPHNTLFNFGGFTDGDRAILTAIHFQSPIIGLLGFDFGKKIGRYSYQHSPLKKDFQKKISKFEIAKDIISKSYHEHSGKRYNLTSLGESILGFERISVTNFIQAYNQWKMSLDK
jgi:uncharacterized Rossmann fold enzyme